jgi:hypothetical protein
VILAALFYLAAVLVGVFLAPADTFNGYTLLAFILAAIGVIIHYRSEV